MESLLNSPIWPLGSVFLSLINARQTLCTSFPSVTTQSKTEEIHSEIDHEEPRASSNSEQARNLGNSLQNSDKPNNINKKPSLSYRLTSPSSQKNHNSYRGGGGSSKDSQRWIQSFQKNNQQNNLHPNSSPTSKHTPTNLANRLTPFPEPFTTSSNRIQCTTRSLRGWGPPPTPTHNKPPHVNQLDSFHSNKPSGPYHHPNSTLNSTPSSHTKTNSGFHSPKTKSFNSCKRSNQDHFQDDTCKKKKSKPNPLDWDWNHWSHAAYSRSENKPHVSKSSRARNVHSAHLSESWRNRSPSLCDSADARANAIVSAAEWKKKAMEENSRKVQSSKHEMLRRPSAIPYKKQKMSPELDHQDSHTRHHKSRSISPALSSSHAGLIPSRLPNESDKNYFRLPPLHPALKESIKRAVYSWINQVLVESFWKIGIWFEDTKRWKSDQWGAIRLDQLAIIVDLYYARGLNCLLRACKTDRFIDIFTKPVHSGLFFLNKDTHNNTDHLRLTKDFSPIGLLYRPIIKGLRRQKGVTGKNRIQIEKFVRTHLLHSEEEDLIYLFQDDDDPYGCLRRAERDGIVEIYEEEEDHYSYQHITFGNRGGCSEHHPSHNGKNKRKRLGFEDKFIALKPHWLSNKDLTDLPPIYSPTISQGGSSAVLQTEEEFNNNPSNTEGIKNQLGHHQNETSDMNTTRTTTTGSKKEKSEPCSKTSSTNTDASYHIDQQENNKLFPANVQEEEDHQKEKQEEINQLPKSTHLHHQLLLNKPSSSSQNFIPVAAFSSPDDDLIIDCIINQFRKDISAL